MKHTMCKLLAVLLCLVLLLTGCAGKETTWQEQYDLGVRYLSEGNYDEAILAFEAAIQIDPKNELAYIGLIDLYGALQNQEMVRSVLKEALEQCGETESLQEKEEELQTQEKPEQAISDVPLEGYPKSERHDYGDNYYSIEDFDAYGRKIKEYNHFSNGTYEILEYNEWGEAIISTQYLADDTVAGVWQWTYNDSGNLIEFVTNDYTVTGNDSSNYSQEKYSEEDATIVLYKLYRFANGDYTEWEYSYEGRAVTISVSNLSQKYGTTPMEAQFVYELGSASNRIATWGPSWDENGIIDITVFERSKNGEDVRSVNLYTDGTMEEF